MTEFTERDRKELRRFVRKYGRKKVAAEVSTASLPAKPGRPRKSPEAKSESKEDSGNIAYHLLEWEAEYREAGEKNPVELALRDVYELLQPKQPYDRWCKTTLRKLGPIRRDIDDYLKAAQEGANRIAELKLRNNSRE
jgi:hypothetical protein